MDWLGSNWEGIIAILNAIGLLIVGNKAARK